MTAVWASSFGREAVWHYREECGEEGGKLIGESADRELKAVLSCADAPSQTGKEGRIESDGKVLIEDREPKREAAPHARECIRALEPSGAVPIASTEQR